MWLTPEQGTPIEYRRRIVCGSRKSIRSSASAITSAYFPSGVKYRLYGSGTGTGGPRGPVAGRVGAGERRAGVAALGRALPPAAPTALVYAANGRTAEGPHVAR